MKIHDERIVVLLAVAPDPHAVIGSRLVDGRERLCKTFGGWVRSDERSKQLLNARVFFRRRAAFDDNSADRLHGGFLDRGDFGVAESLPDFPELVDVRSRDLLAAFRDGAGFVEIGHDEAGDIDGNDEVGAGELPLDVRAEGYVDRLRKGKERGAVQRIVVELALAEKVDGDDDVCAHLLGHVDREVVDESPVDEIVAVVAVGREDAGDAHARAHRVGKRAVGIDDLVSVRDVRRDGPVSAGEFVEIGGRRGVHKEGVEEADDPAAGNEPSVQRNAFGVKLERSRILCPVKAVPPGEARFALILDEQTRPVGIHRDLFYFGRGISRGVERADDRAHARADDDVDGNAEFFDNLEDADVREAPGASAFKDDGDFRTAPRSLRFQWCLLGAKRQYAREKKDACEQGKRSRSFHGAMIAQIDPDVWKSRYTFAGKIATMNRPCEEGSMKERCGWVNPDNDLYVAYHDEEWGVPVHDDRTLFEMLILEGAQAGLSWETVLKKRDNYRRAFKNFDIDAILKFTERDEDALMLDGGIIRNRLKIKSVRINADVFRAISKEFGSFDAYLWAFVGNKQVDCRFHSLADLPTRDEISDAISKDLKKRGMKFIGSTIIYAYMQAVGLVNAHTTNCFRYGEVKKIKK